MRLRSVTVVLAALAVGLLSGCASSPEGSPETAPGSATCTYTEAAGAVRDVSAPPAVPAQTGTVEVVLETSAGDIPIALDADRTPCTVGSFVSLAEQGYFDGSNCHRLTTSGIYVLQCGDPSATGRGGPGYNLPDELDGSETYPAGTVAMANTGSPGTGGSQFFLVYEDSQLPPSYTVFGQLDAAGLAVVQEVAAAGAEGGAADGAPATPVVIGSVVVTG